MKLKPRTVISRGRARLVIAGELENGTPIEERQVERDGIPDTARWLAELEGRPDLVDDYALQLTKLLDQAEVLHRVRKAIGRAKKPAQAFDLVDDLAKLPAAELAKAKADLKAKIGKALNLNDLSRAVTESRKRARENVINDRTAVGDDGLLRICITDRQLREVVDDSLLALTQHNTPPATFLRNGNLVRLKVDEKGRTSIAELSEAGLRGRLERAANYFAVAKEGLEFVELPPIAVVRDILALNVNEELGRLEYRRLPGLDAVVESPVVRPDGTILLKAGYDPRTRLFYAPAPSLLDLQVEDTPTNAQVADAVAVVDEVICDFPFDDEASHANFWGHLVTLFVRPAIDGRVPLAMYDKPTPGTGGSLLAEAAVAIATGRDVEMTGAPREEEEWRKLVSTLLGAGDTVILIDNVEHVLESDALARAITAGEWSDRALGTMEKLRAPSRAVWAVTGNNVALGRNLVRRVYPIRLDAKMPDPHRRSGFRHPELLPWILQERRRIVAAVLTVCRSWYAAGRPAAGTPVMGSFEAWSRVVGGILAHAGVHGFLGNWETMLEESGEEKRPWEAFLTALALEFGLESFSVAQVERRISSRTDLRDVLPNDLSELVQVIPSQSPVYPDTVKIGPKFKIRLGKAFQKRAGTRYGDGVYVERAGEDTDKKIALWRVTSSGGTGSLWAGQTTPGSTPRSDKVSIDQGLYENTGSTGSVSNLNTRENTPTHAQGPVQVGTSLEHSPDSPYSPESEAPDEYEAAERRALNEPGM